MVLFTRLGIKRIVWQKKIFISFLGTGVIFKNATFNRPFDHTLLVTGNTTADVKILNRYKKVFTPLSLSAFYQIGDHWMISGEIISNFLVYRCIDHTESSRGGFPYTEGTFELDDVQFRLGMNGRKGRILIGIHSRMANVQKIDRIIFNRILKDP